MRCAFWVLFSLCFCLSVCLSFRSDDSGPIVQLAIRYRATAAGGGGGCSMDVVMLSALSSLGRTGSHTCPPFFPTPSAPLTPPCVVVGDVISGIAWSVSCLEQPRWSVRRWRHSEYKSRWQLPAGACMPSACVFFKTPTLCSICHVQAEWCHWAALFNRQLGGHSSFNQKRLKGIWGLMRLAWIIDAAAVASHSCTHAHTHTHTHRSVCSPVHLNPFFQ